MISKNMSKILKITKKSNADTNKNLRPDRVNFYLCPAKRVAVPSVNFLNFTLLNPAARIIKAKLSGAGKFATEAGR